MDCIGKLENMRYKKLRDKMVRWLTKLPFQSIRMFCFHHVSEEFEPDTIWECDWIQFEDFKEKILALKTKYTIVSLTEVQNRLVNDCFRMKHYAALTADDGWASVKNVLPWLAEQNIPIVLFLNHLYLDGKHHRERQLECFLLEDDERFVWSIRMSPSECTAGNILM